MKPKHQRLIFVLVSVLFLCIAVLLTLRAFEQNIVFFYAPSDLAKQPIAPDALIRIGGLIEKGSIRQQANDEWEFVITDGNAEITVKYRGMVPNLFREGQGAIAEGTLTSQTPPLFTASRILTKHDEKYVPREVADALKKSGRWREGSDNGR